MRHWLLTAGKGLKKRLVVTSALLAIALGFATAAIVGTRPDEHGGRLQDTALWFLVIVALRGARQGIRELRHRRRMRHYVP